MDSDRLKDLIAKGMGLAAQKVGQPFIVYRPSGPNEPLSERNRVIRLFAAFELEGAGNSRSAGSVWRGIFDALYAQVGNYLVGQSQVFFVASQLPNLPSQCVLTNHLINLTRPSLTAQGGYSSLFPSGGDTILSGWPAAIIAGTSHSARLQAGGTGSSGWTILLPDLPLCPRAFDVLSDDTGASYVVGEAEKGPLGWRLLAKQVTP